MPDGAGTPRVTGFLGTADLVEDLAFLGALDRKLVFGSMNRGGLCGSTFEIDDRMTAYDADGIAARGLDGGKVLLRIDAEHPATPAALKRASNAVDQLAARGRRVLIEPFVVPSTETGVVADLGTAAVGFARWPSRRRWGARRPCRGSRSLRRRDGEGCASEQPALPPLGRRRALSDDASAARWRSALQLPTVKGMVVGRALLYPTGGDVTAAIDHLTESL